MTISDILNPKQKDKIRNNEEKNLKLTAKDKAKDGYWVILQSWSQCTLKCGGGKSFLQRMCVPPKNGGKSCIGESIISKDCNTKPCPDMQKTQNYNNTKILKPVIKVMPFSNKPQRYSKCVIKEGDMFLIKSLNEDKKNEEIKFDDNTLKIPIRLVMNNRTITLFSGEDYDSRIMTFILKKTRFDRDTKNQDCFIIYEDAGNKASLCSFVEANKLIEEWDYDFHLFKYQCNFNKPVHVFDEFQKKLNYKIKDIKKSLLDEAQDKMRLQAQQTEEMKLESSIRNTNKVALQAIRKEVNIEELIKQEELEREKREEQIILKRIEEEKKKSVNLSKIKLKIFFPIIKFTIKKIGLFDESNSREKIRKSI